MLSDKMIRELVLSCVVVLGWMAGTREAPAEICIYCYTFAISQCDLYWLTLAKAQALSPP